MAETKGPGKAHAPGRRLPVGDAGHISVSMSAPEAANAARQHVSQPDSVAVRLEIQEASDGGGAFVTLHLDTRGSDQAGKGLQQPSRQSRLAQQFDQVMQSQASAAALSGMQSLAGLLKGPKWTRQGPPISTAAPSSQEESAAEAAQDKEGADRAIASSLASDAAVQEDSPAKLVAVQISVSEAGAEHEASIRPCSVTLRIILGDASTAAAVPIPSAPGSAPHGRLGAFSGLFRSSRGGSQTPVTDLGSILPLREVAAETTDPEIPAAQSLAGADPQATNAASDTALAGERQNPAWAVAGAFGSLYGFVSHAADSAVRSGQQVCTPCTLLHLRYVQFIGQIIIRCLLGIIVNCLYHRRVPRKRMLPRATGAPRPALAAGLLQSHRALGAPERCLHPPSRRKRRRLPQRSSYCA